MTKRPNSKSDKNSREDRLKAALRANLNRRKTQGRARAADASEDQAVTSETADRATAEAAVADHEAGQSGDPQADAADQPNQEK